MPLLLQISYALHALPQLGAVGAMDKASTFPISLFIFFSALWMLNHIVRTVRLSRSAMYELRASASLLNTDSLRGAFLVSFAFMGVAILFSLANQPFLALPSAFAGVLTARYLFFVSVVPLNMALTFVRTTHI
jgi:hypothetical protein